MKNLNHEILDVLETKKEAQQAALAQGSIKARSKRPMRSMFKAQSFRPWIKVKALRSLRDIQRKPEQE